jgi:hypothetical protein
VAGALVLWRATYGATTSEILDDASATRVGLDDQQCQPPSAQAAGQQHEQGPVGCGAARALDCASQDDHLLAKQRILGDEFGLGPPQIGQCTEGEQRGGGTGSSHEKPLEGVHDVASGIGEALAELGEHGERSISV